MQVRSTGLTFLPLLAASVVGIDCSDVMWMADLFANAQWKQNLTRFIDQVDNRVLQILYRTPQLISVINGEDGGDQREETEDRSSRPEHQSHVVIVEVGTRVVAQKQQMWLDTVGSASPQTPTHRVQGCSRKERCITPF